MGHVFQYLGLTVGCLDDTEPSSPERRAAYLADITYGTNNEFGFDYLRDNMVFSLDQRVQREHAYAIIDEVDSILIDEARTPLIISGPVGNETDEKYAQFNRQVAELVRKQTGVVNTLLAEAERLLEDPKTRNDAALKLYQAPAGHAEEQAAAQDAERDRDQADGPADGARRHRRPEAADEAAADARSGGDALLRAGREGPLGAPDRSRRRGHVARTSRSCSWCRTSRRRSTGSTRTRSCHPHDRIERRRQVESDYAIKSEKLHIIHKLLQAHVLYEKEVDYLVQDGQVMIVDEFTGRVMTGRRWADGLHQAVEAKEGVQVKGETQTFATITIQNYFRMYDKLAGMTGTAETEETEFYSIYGLEVSVIPDPPPDHAARPGRPDLQDPEGEAQRDHGRGRAAARAGLADPDRHGERGRVGDAFPPAQAPRPQARSAERQVSPARGRDRGRGRAEGRHHHRHQHGRPGHRHQTGQGSGSDRKPRPDSRSSAPSGTSHAGSTGSFGAAPAGREIRASRSSSSRWKTI